MSRNSSLSWRSIAVLFCLGMFSCTSQAFVTPSTALAPICSTTTYSSTASSLSMIDSTFLTDFASSNLWLATIDSDIANIPTNEFRTVFLGGLIVMAGGLLSAIAVGVMLEASDGYAAVVAESYDLEADETFWKGLSEEEAKKAKEMLAKVKTQRGETVEQDTTALPLTADKDSSDDKSPMTNSKPTASSTNPATAPSSSSSSADDKKVDMFSDY